MTPITWSPSGDEITFISQDLRTAYAYRWASDLIHSLYSSPSSTELTYDATLSADGVDWFTSSGNLVAPPSRTIRRHVSAASAVVTDRGKSTFLQGGILVAPGQPLAAFTVLPDSLFLLRRGDEPKFLGSGCEGLVAFSQEQDRVLCSTAATFPHLTLRVFPINGSTAEVLVLPSAVQYLHLIHWGPQGIQVLYTNESVRGYYLVYDLDTGSSRSFSPTPGSEESLSLGRVSWSSDGRKAAYWTTYCAQQGGLFSGCALEQNFLYVLDVGTATAKRVAVHTSGSASRTSLSPTGSRIAYTYNSGFFLLDVK